MRIPRYVAITVVLFGFVVPTRGSEPISPPSRDLIQLIRTAHDVLVFPLPTPEKPRRDDRRMRPLPPNARRELLHLLGSARNWYDGFDSRGYIRPDPPNVGFLFRRGRDELILFFSQGEMIDARFNGHRQPTRLSLDGHASEEMEKWRARYAQPELRAPKT